MERDVYYSLPFLLLFQVGFGYVGLASVYEGAPRPARRVGCEAPAPQPYRRNSVRAALRRSRRARSGFSYTATPRSSRPTSAKPIRSQNAFAPGFSSPTESRNVLKPGARERVLERGDRLLAVAEPLARLAEEQQRRRARRPAPGGQVEVEDADRGTAGCAARGEDPAQVVGLGVLEEAHAPRPARRARPRCARSSPARPRSRPAIWAACPAPRAPRADAVERSSARAVCAPGASCRRSFAAGSAHSVAWSRGSARRAAGRVNSPVPRARRAADARSRPSRTRSAPGVRERRGDVVGAARAQLRARRSARSRPRAPGSRRACAAATSRGVSPTTSASRAGTGRPRRADGAPRAPRATSARAPRRRAANPPTALAAPLEVAVEAAAARASAARPRPTLPVQSPTTAPRARERLEQRPRRPGRTA